MRVRVCGCTCVATHASRMDYNTAACWATGGLLGHSQLARKCLRPFLEPALLLSLTLLPGTDKVAGVSRVMDTSAGEVPAHARRLHVYGFVHICTVQSATRSCICINPVLSVSFATPPHSCPRPSPVQCAQCFASSCNSNVRCDLNEQYH